MEEQRRRTVRFRSKLLPVAMRLGVTPVPIPNTMVKTQAADDTMLETVWESRRLPDSLWGYSSVGRAPALQAGGQGFESLYLHGSNEESAKFFWKTVRAMLASARNCFTEKITGLEEYRDEQTKSANLGGFGGAIVLR